MPRGAFAGAVGPCAPIAGPAAFTIRRSGGKRVSAAATGALAMVVRRVRSTATPCSAAIGP